MNAARETASVAPTVSATNDVRGALRHAEPMARHTSWRVGGPAQHFFLPADEADLAAFMAALPPEEPVFWLGLGSNLLVRDGGVRGTVIATRHALRHISQPEPRAIRVAAGVPCPKIARFSAHSGLAGAEFMAGIPGTLGGALAMNAGAFGGETWDLVETVECMDRNGIRHNRTRSDYQIGYRRVQRVIQAEPEWFTAAWLRLSTGDGASIGERVRLLLDQRNRSQPTSEASAGSVFRNPPGLHAARLIEECGLKGTCIGGACVSEKHANFIINTGGALAADIEALIIRVATTVERHHGVRLTPEVQIVGVPE